MRSNRLIPLILAVLMAAPVLPVSALAGDWALKGAALNLDSTQDGFSPVLAAAPLDTKDTLYAAWSEGRAPSQVHVKAWDGRMWRTIGEGLNIGQDRIAVGPSLTVSGSVLYTAWSESEPHGFAQLYVKARDLAPPGSGGSAAAWRLLGNQSLNVDTLRHAMAPSLSAAASTPPAPQAIVAAWIEWLQQGPFLIYVKSWSGTAWKAVGRGALNVHRTSGTAAFPALVVSASAAGPRPIVAWSESRGEGPSQLYVKAWNGQVWEFLGQSLAGGGLNLDSSRHAEEPVLATDGKNVAVAWSEGPSLRGTEVAVKLWDGATWTLVRPHSSPGGPPGSTIPTIETSPAIAIRNGVITLAWMEQDFPGRGPGRIRVAQWSKSDSQGGARWLPLGTAPLNVNPQASAWTPTVALRGETPYVGWVECSPCRVFVKAYESVPNRDLQRPLPSRDPQRPLR